MYRVLSRLLRCDCRIVKDLEQLSVTLQGILVSPAEKDNLNLEDFHQNSLTDSISLVILSIRMGFFIIHSLESISGSVF